MKKILRFWFIYLVSLKLVQGLIPVILFSEGNKTLILVAAALTVFELVIKPIVKILLLPINILTLGLTRWVVNLIGLYLATFLVSGLTIKAYFFPGVNWQGFIIPSFPLSLLATYILISFSINFSFSLIRWLFKK